MARPPIFELAMTPAERQRRSRNTLRESIHAEADLAGDILANVRRGLPRSMTGTTADEQLLQVIDALDRIRDMVRR